MFILSSTSSGLAFSSVNHTSMYENSGLKVFKYIGFLRDISNNWPNYFFGTNLCKTLESHW